MKNKFGMIYISVVCGILIRCIEFYVFIWKSVIDKVQLDVRFVRMKLNFVIRNPGKRKLTRVDSIRTSVRICDKITFVARVMCVQYVFFHNIWSHFSVRSALIIRLPSCYSRVILPANSDWCEIDVWGRHNIILTFFVCARVCVCVRCRMEIYRFIVWKKDHVCPSGSLRVNKKNEKLKKKKARGRREQNGRSTLVSIFFKEQP